MRQKKENTYSYVKALRLLPGTVGVPSAIEEERFHFFDTEDSKATEKAFEFVQQSRRDGLTVSVYRRPAAFCWNRVRLIGELSISESAAAAV